MKDTLEQLVRDGLRHLAEELGQAPRDERKGREEVVLEHPVDLGNGDYTTNAALVTAKQFGKSPREVAELLAAYMDTRKPEGLEVIEIAGAGFLNFYLSKAFFKNSLEEIIENGENFGKTGIFASERVMVEHTDPNPFKRVHVGHLMPSTIGSTVANVFAWNGAEVKQAIYMGDVGLHVAKAIYGLRQGKELDEAYVYGHTMYEANEEAKAEITVLNKEIYERSDPLINDLYDKGRRLSLEDFDALFKRLGLRFDYTFFESEAAPVGKIIVENKRGEIFEESEGAVVFHAEKYDPTLHTRVFINREGLPTYEAKELGLAKLKADAYPYTRSVVVTGNEIKDYFRVLLAAMRYVFPDLAEKTKHLPHGMLRLPSGKMSSRTGDVIPAEELIEAIKRTITERGQTATDEIAVGAIRYMILKQSIGSDIVFDLHKSVSTEGDSGPYLQYAYARSRSLINKASKEANSAAFTLSTGAPTPDGIAPPSSRPIERLLYRFPEVVARAGKEYAPHYITTYLIELAAAFNNFYAHEQVIGDSPEAAYRLAIVEAFAIVLKNGLTILGIPAPERM